MQEKCPYCKKVECIPEVAFLNCEAYDSRFYTVKCRHCKKVLRVSLIRTVIIGSIEKSDKTLDQCDW